MLKTVFALRFGLTSTLLGVLILMYTHDKVKVNNHILQLAFEYQKELIPRIQDIDKAKRNTPLAGDREDIRFFKNMSMRLLADPTLNYDPTIKEEITLFIHPQYLQGQERMSNLQLLTDWRWQQFSCHKHQRTADDSEILIEAIDDASKDSVALTLRIIDKANYSNRVSYYLNDLEIDTSELRAYEGELSALKVVVNNFITGDKKTYRHHE